MPRNSRPPGTAEGSLTQRELLHAVLTSTLPPPQRRKIALDVMDITPKQIAEEQDVSRQMVAKTLRGPGHGRSERIEEAIAERLGVTVDLLYPEYAETQERE